MNNDDLDLDPTWCLQAVESRGKFPTWNSVSCPIKIAQTFYHFHSFGHLITRPITNKHPNLPNHKIKLNIKGPADISFFVNKTKFNV